jgi:UDP-3-O-[3-hydroxymyristoyl] glucosamine N-acyltransferase
MTTAVKFGGSDTNYEKKRRKYILTNQTKTLDNGVVLYRIKSLYSFASASRGQLGGWIQHEGNLSHDGDCWIFDNAQVYGSASVSGNARVHNLASISLNASVKENAIVGANSIVYGNAVIQGDARIFGDSRIGGNTIVTGYARIEGGKNSDIIGGTFYDEAQLIGDVVSVGNPKVYGRAKVHGRIRLSGYPSIFGDASVIEEMSDHLIVREVENKSGFIQGIKIEGNAKVYGDAYISGHVTIKDDSEVFGNAYVAGYAIIKDKAHVRDNAQVYKQPYIGGLSVIGENTQINGYPYIVGKSRILGSSQIQGHAYIYGYGKSKDGVLITGNSCIGGFTTISGSIVINGSYARRHIDNLTEYSYRDIKTGQVVTYTKEGLVDLTSRDCNSSWGTHIDGLVNIWSARATYYTDVKLSLAFATITNINDGLSISYRNIRKKEPINFYGDYGLSFGNIKSATIFINGREYPITVHDSQWNLTVSSEILVHNIDYNLVELTEEERAKPFYLSEHYKDIKRIKSQLTAELIIEFSENADSDSFWVRATKDVLVSVRQPTPLQPKVYLEEDTGRSDSDRITKNRNLIVISTESELGTLCEYTFNDTDWFSVIDDKVQLEDGEWKSSDIKFRCIDEFGNVSQVVPLYDTITIDTKIESPRQFLTIDSGVSSTDFISNKGGYKVVGLESGLLLWYSINSGDWVSFEQEFKLEEGVYPSGAIRIKAEDIAGNLTIFNNPIQIVIDKSISISSNYSEFDGNRVINQQGDSIETLTFEINTDDPTNVITSLFARDSNDVLYELPISSFTIDSLGKLITNIDVSSFPDGNINFYISAEDIAGNKQISGTSVFKDTVTFIDVSMNPEFDSGASASDFITNEQQIIFNGIGEIGSTISLEINGESYGNVNVSGDGSFTFVSNPLPEGTHTLKFKAKDRYNNIAYKEIDLVIDRTPPKYFLSKNKISPTKPKIIGYTEPNVKINLLDKENNFISSWNSDEFGYFDVSLYSEPEDRTFIVEAEDRAGNKTRLSKSMKLTSRGNDDSMQSTAGVLDGSIHYSAQRGVSLFAVDSSSSVYYFRTFDTFLNTVESDSLSNQIEQLKLDVRTHQIGIVTNDEWTQSLTNSLRISLEQIDVPWEIIYEPEYRSSLVHLSEHIDGLWNSVFTQYKPRYSSELNTVEFNQGQVFVQGFSASVNQIQKDLEIELFDYWILKDSLTGFKGNTYTSVGNVSFLDNSLFLDNSSAQLQTPYLHSPQFTIGLDFNIPNGNVIDYSCIFNYESDWELAVKNNADGNLELVWAISGNLGSSWEWIETGIEISHDTWYNVNYVYDYNRQVFDLYIDSVLVYSNGFRRIMNTSCSVFTIGGRSCIINQSTARLKVLVKNFSIWLKPLNQEQISYVYDKTVLNGLTVF